MRLNAVHVVFSLLLFSLFIQPIQSIPTGIGSSSSDGCLCHGSSSNATSTVLLGIPEQYDSNQSFNLSLVIESSVEQNANASQGGFRLRVNQGAVEFEQTSHAQVIEDGWTHTLNGSQHRIWNFTWTSPIDNSTSTTFTVHGNAVNGNGNSMGDVWNSFAMTIPGTGFTGEIIQPEVPTFEYSNFYVILTGLSVLLLLLYFAVR